MIQSGAAAECVPNESTIANMAKMQSTEYWPEDKPSPLPWVIGAVLVATVIGSGVWVVRGVYLNANRSVSETAVTAAGPIAKQPSASSRSAKSAAPLLQATDLNKQSQPENLSLESIATGTAPVLTSASNGRLASELTTVTAATPDASDSDKPRPVETLIYSQIDVDVVPPMPESVQSLNPPPTELDQDEVATIEVIVNELGTVDSVKTTSIPRNLSESIWITSALHTLKAGQFRPAIKDGQPVRYRLLIPVGER